MSNATKINGVNFQNLSKFSTVEMEKIASFLHSATVIENWVDYMNPSLWNTGTNLATISGSFTWIFGNSTSTHGMARNNSKSWGQMGTPAKARIRIEKTNSSDSDAVLDYILLRAYDSAGEPQLRNIGDYPPSGNITITNAGLEVDLDLNWNLGTPPLKFQSISFQPATSSGFDLKVTKVQFYDANDPTSYINSNPRFRNINLATEFIVSGTNLSYEATRTGFFKISPPGVMNPPGQWQTGYVYSVGSATIVFPGVRYICIQSHTSASINEPGVGGQWADYWVVEYFYLIANGGWNVGFRPTQLVIALQLDTDNSEWPNHDFALQDVDGNTLANNSSNINTDTGFSIVTLYPNFGTYGKDLYRLRFKKSSTGANYPDYIRIRSIGFWYNA
jgi:hypothetical protein